MMAFLLSGHWLPLVINIALQSLFVLAAAAVVLACARKVSASRRHLVSVAALVTLFLIPLISLLIPAPQPLLQVSGPGLTLRRSPIRSPFASVPFKQAGVSATASGLASAPSLTPSTPPAGVASPQPAPGAAHTAAASISFSRFAPWLAAFWLIGFVGVLGRLLLGLERIQRMARQDTGVLPELLNTQVSVLLSEVGFARPVTILQASNKRQVSVAMTWGVRKPTLLLPAEAAEWQEERLRVVLLHELAHIRRYDWLTQIFGQIVCALYWFHPLVWLLNRHAQIEAERACDDAVLLAGVRAKEYATHLLDVVRAMQAGREAPSAAVAMARPTQVRYRLQSILNARRNRNSATRLVRTLVLSVTTLLLCAVSWLRPLAWANRHLQPTDPKQPAVIGSVVHLPNGVAVELTAVGSDPMGYGDDWWTPDGKPLFEAPDMGYTIFSGGGEPFGSRFLRRALFFRLRSQQKMNISTTGYVVDPTRHLQTEGTRYGRAARFDNAELVPTSAGSGRVLLGFLPTDTQCTYRFGVATGPWETIATTPFALNATPDAIFIPATAIKTATVFYSDDNPRISYREPQGREHTLSLLGGHAPLGDVARRVVALDKDGKEVVQNNFDYEVPKDASPLPLWAQARIVAFRVQTRPYQWAEFKNIHLEHLPVTKLTPIASPPILPAFRHTFACGVILTVPAVTESRKEGAACWRPNGEPLSGPLKEWGPINYPAWSQKTRSRIVLIKLQNPRPFSYTTAERTSPAVPEDHCDWPPGFEMPINVVNPIFTGVMHDFPRTQLHTTLRYGIAAGAWKSAATIPMPQDIRQTDDTQAPAWADLTLEVPGFPEQGETPTLTYTTTQGKAVQLAFTISDKSYLSDVARRFVAVDMDGKIIPLSSNPISHRTLDAAGKPILLDPAHADMNDLRGRDYKRREFDGVELAFRSTSGSYKYHPIDLTKIREFRLEVRPYEWAEFANIALQPTKGTSAR